MKNLKIIRKSILMLLVAFQMNNVKANTLNPSSIDELAKQVAISEEGIDFITSSLVSFAKTNNAYSLLSESEKLIRKEKIEKFQKLANYEFTAESKEEYAKLMGYRSYDSFDKLISTRNEASKKLIAKFPIISAMNDSEKALLFEKAMNQLDFNLVANANVKDKEECRKNALRTWGYCLIPGGGTAAAGFVSCFIASVVGTTVITVGTGTIAVSTVAYTGCMWLFGATGLNFNNCTTKYEDNIDKCQ